MKITGAITRLRKKPMCLRVVWIFFEPSLNQSDGLLSLSFIQERLQSIS